MDKGGGEGVLTEGEQSYILQKYSELKTPFNYDYADGWKQLLGSSPMLLVMTALILSFIMSGVFSGEFALKADPNFLFPQDMGEAKRYGLNSRRQLSRLRLSTLQ